MIDEARAARLIAAWKTWLEAQPIERLVPKEKALDALRRLSDERVAQDELRPRIERAFDALHERLRGLDRSAADLLGPRAAERLIDLAGDLEPDERAVKSFFEERAVGDLLGSVLYDGINEFMKKANQLSDMLPGVQAAKKVAGGLGGLLGSIGGGLAGSIAGGMREEVEKRVEQQVRAFLAGFGKIAVERAVRFATSPANQKLFREMRRNLAKKALERPLKELVSKLTPEKAADLKRKLADAAIHAAADERTSKRIEKEIERFAAKHGQETPAALAKRWFGDVLPTEPVAKLLGPGLAEFLETEAAKRELRP